VGIRQSLDLFHAGVDLALEQQQRSIVPTGRGRLGLLSPWAGKGSLVTIDWDESTWGRRPREVTRSDAMRCAPVKKGRALLQAVLKTAPLEAIRFDQTSNTDVPLTGQAAPSWLYRSDTGVSPELRMEGILDDHLFNEASVLAVKRGATGILDAVHLPYDWWEVDPDDGTILVNDLPAAEDAVVYLPGPSAGLLVDARDDIRGWLDMARNIRRRLSSPMPGILLEDQDSGDADDDDVDEMVAKVAEARRSPDGAVMYVPAGIKATVVPLSDDAQMYIEARNASRIDLANHLNLPVALLDGSPATASLTYSTSEGKRSEFDDYSVDYWSTPIESGLSQDNVVPRGTRIRFNFAARYAATNAPTGAPTQD
jgi:hypothetical protein